MNLLFLNNNKRNGFWSFIIKKNSLTQYQKKGGVNPYKTEKKKKKSLFFTYEKENKLRVVDALLTSIEERMLLLIDFVISILLVVVIAYLWHIRQIYNTFNQLNISGPEPTFFFENFSDLVKTKRSSISIKQWTEKYDRIFGYFEWPTPILVISDLDLSSMSYFMKIIYY